MKPLLIRNLAVLMTLGALLILARLKPAAQLPSTVSTSDPSSVAVTGEHVSGQVGFVADGDSFELRTDDGRTVQVRLHGIDAPEWRQPFSDQAREALTRQIRGRRVELTVMDADQYGRLVGDLHCGGKWINEVLVADGWAWHYKRYSDNAALAHAEQQARAAGRGLWRDANPIPPWEWRRRHPRAESK